MSNIKLKFSVMTFILLLFNSCSSQNDKQTGDEKAIDTKLVNRQPAVAGQFYPANSDELKETLENLFSQATPKKSEDVLAIICPHAGYVYSGEVAASGFNQIDENKKYENIFIISSSHRNSFEGASIYSIGNYITPLGIVEVNRQLADKLIKENPVFNFSSDYHLAEHSLEVQLPFLQYKMKTSYKIIPILLGTQTPEICKKVASSLKPYFNSNNLFIISSDFSHYPDYKNATDVDKKTADAIQSNSPDNLIKTMEDNESKNISNLATSLCGWTSVLTMLYMTKDIPDISIKAIQYKNSGDASEGDKSRVVGYWAMTVSGKIVAKSSNTEFTLTEKDKKDLLKIARTTIEQYIKENKIPKLDTKDFSETIKTNCGAFVTLHKDNALRGCIGRFSADEPLYKVIQDMAIASSTQDNRFSPVTTDEINKIEIEISVLTPMKKINSIDEIVLGKHGIYIKKGYASGTFLPQVATETGWTKEEFLGHCAKDKAGIGWDGWKDAEIYIYEANVFGEKNLNE